MIQRIQTLYMMLAVIVSIICICLPVGTFTLSDGSWSATLYNGLLSEPTADGPSLDFGVVAVWPLFLLHLLAVLFTGFSIFMYKSRSKQIVLCTLAMLCYGLWYADAAWAGWFSAGLADAMKDAEYGFTPSLWMALPFAGVVFEWLAIKGVRADQKLIRSMDRIR